MALEVVLVVMALSVWPAVPAARQHGVPVALSATLRANVKNERLEVVTSIRGLPLGVRDKLQELFGSEALDIAEPNTDFQNNTKVASDRPRRRLIAAGCSIARCLVHYERIGKDHTWLVILFHWTPAETRIEWGGQASSGLATIDAVRNAVLAGMVRGPVTSW
jgi:hypothetical protein